MPTPYYNLTSNAGTWMGLSIQDFQLKVYDQHGTQTADVQNHVFAYQEKYRYGFQGQERDDEIKGVGNSYSFNYRVYDPRICRWLSFDPLGLKFPFYSPFHFAGNKPISAVDLEGLEDIYFAESFSSVKEGKEAIQLLESTEIGVEILETFKMVQRKNDDPGNQGFDIFVRGYRRPNSSVGGTTDRRTLDLRGVIPDLEQPKAKTTPLNEYKRWEQNFVSVSEKILEAREEKSGVYFEYFSNILGEDVLMGDDILKSIENGRKIIIISINLEWAGGAYSQYMSQAGINAYALGHEINSHAINISRNIKIDVKDEHKTTSGLWSRHLYENSDEKFPDTQLRNQIIENESSQ